MPVREPWPRLLKVGRGPVVWTESPLVALERYADRAEGDPMVAVPVDLLREAAAWRECSARTMLTADEDGDLPEPVEIVCRRQLGHDHRDNPEVVRNHHNGYIGWK